jgi:chitodextrinase
MLAAPTISYVQGNYATPNKPQTTVNVKFTAAQAAGDLNVVVVGWSDSTATVSAVSDTMRNVYTRAVGPTVQSGIASQSMYYAKNIVSAAAGANTVTVTFSSAATSPDIRILEYSDADRNNPVDVTAASSGNSATSNSGSATTTNATDLIFGANLAQVKTAGPGSGFTQRLLTSPDGDIAEDRMVAATGSYSATAPLKSSAQWIMQMVALRLGPTFTISPSSTSLSIMQGKQGTSTFTTDIGGGFNSSISLSASGMPSGTTVSFNPNPIPAPGAGSSTMTITVGSSTPTGTYTITVTGNGGGVQKNATVKLTVTAAPNFTLSASPASLSVVQGNQGTSTITTTISGGFNGAISLSASGMPSGTTVSFNPGTIPAPGAGSSTMTITVGASTPVGTYPILVTGNGGGIQQTGTVTLTVTAAPNFTLSASPASLSVVQGNQGTSAITTTISGGFNSAISLAASGMPSGTTVSFNPGTIPAPGAGSSTMTITVGASTATGTYPITVTGNGGGIQQNTTVTLTVLPQVIPTAPTNVAVVNGGPGPIVDAVQSYINPTFLMVHTTAAFDSTGGDLIVLSTSSHFGVTFTPSDNFGNSWIAIAGPTTTAMGFDLRTQLWYAPNPIVGPGHTVTMSISQAVPLVMSVIVVKNSNLSSPIDAVSLIGSDNGTQTVNVASPNISTTSTNDLLIGFVKVSAGATFQPGTGFMQQSAGSSNFLDAETGAAATPGTYKATFTLDASQTWQSAVVAVANNPNQTTVTWTASTENGGTIAQYLVERCQGINCASFAQIGTTANTANNDTGLTASTSYSYRVRAQDTSGNLGPYSAVASLLMPAAIPSLPSNLTTTSPSNTEIDLSWTASTETGGAISNYLVERCQGANCTSFAQIGTSVSTIYNDTSLTPGTIYSYRVRAVDAAGNLSPYSNTASASAQTPDNQPPTAPSNLTAAGVSPSQINLSWTASTDNVGITNYLIERCQDTGCTPTYRINTSPGTIYNDTGLPAVTTYTYRVRATDAAGNLSPYSNVTTATTQLTGSLNFTLAVSPSSLSVMPGNQGISAITTTPSGGFNSAITLSASGMPDGMTVSFGTNPIPAPGSGNSTMTITVGSSTATGTYSIVVTGDGGGIQQNATVTLIVSNTVQDLQITTDTDDVYYDPGGLSGGIWNVSGSLNYNHTSFVGSWNGVVNAFSTGVRYSGVNVPQGAQITRATLSIYGGTMPPINGPSLIRVYGEAADNAPVWADVAGSRPDSIPYTTAHVDYTGSDPGWAGAWHQIDVTAIVQEIVNRGGWVPGNAIAFALTGVDNRNYYLPLADSAQGAGLGPKLEYDVGP